MLKRYHQTSKQGKKQKVFRDNTLYNAIGGSVSGTLVGTLLEGSVGSLAIPTSVRRVIQKLPKNYRDSFKNTDYSKGEKIFERFYNGTRIFTRLSVHRVLLGKALESVIDKDGSLEGWGLLLIPNALNLTYESGKVMYKLGRAFKGFVKKKFREFVKKRHQNQPKSI